MKPTDKSVADYYDNSGYYGQRKFLVERAVNYARVKSVLGEMRSAAPLSLLDVGCGNGMFLLGMRQRGWQSFGTEIAPAFHLQDQAAEFIKKGELKNIDFPDNFFDVITMWHSLEHVNDPLGYLIKARRILKNDGVLVVEVPNFQSWQARFFKKNWFGLDVPRHLFHFSPKSITNFLLRAGFKEIRIKRGSLIYGFFGCWQSILNAVSGKNNLFFDFLNSKKSAGYIYDNHRKDFFVNIVLFVPALIMAVVLFFAEIVTGKDGVILIYARK
jgi:ubiquinone/menaquinone biosynthesis C-methylase UbiE